jgi:hypothetical protein
LNHAGKSTPSGYNIAESVPEIVTAIVPETLTGHLLTHILSTGFAQDNPQVIHKSNYVTHLPWYSYLTGQTAKRSDRK